MHIIWFSARGYNKITAGELKVVVYELDILYIYTDSEKVWAYNYTSYDLSHGYQQLNIWFLYNNNLLNLPISSYFYIIIYHLYPSYLC